MVLEEDENMTPIAVLPGGVKNKAATQNAAAAKRILTQPRGSVWSNDVGEDQQAVDSDIEEDMAGAP